MRLDYINSEIQLIYLLTHSTHACLHICYIYVISYEPYPNTFVQIVRSYLCISFVSSASKSHRLGGVDLLGLLVGACKVAWHPKIETSHSFILLFKAECVARFIKAADPLW